MAMDTRANLDGYAAYEPPVAWSAILAGATTALASSLLLTVLAAGFGYILAPGGMATRGSLAAFTPEVGAGAIAVQVVSAGIGGYLAGRLRPGWSSAHADEAHFRDTAHGLVAWALATVVGALLAATVLTPYADQLAGAASHAGIAIGDERAKNIAAQSSFFVGLGMLLAAFTAAVAGRIGGMRVEHMHAAHTAL